MQGDKWKKLQREVVQSLFSLDARSEFAIVFFDAGMSVFPRSKAPVSATNSMVQAADAMVMSTIPGVGTCPEPALLEALDLAALSTAKDKRIIFFSDGRANCGTDEAQYNESLLAAVAARNTEKVPIDTVLIGTEFIDEDFMQALAAATGGTFTRIP